MDNTPDMIVTEGRKYVRGEISQRLIEERDEALDALERLFSLVTNPRGISLGTLDNTRRILRHHGRLPAAGGAECSVPPFNVTQNAANALADALEDDNSEWFLDND